MADFGTPATPNIKPVDGLATLGSLMELKQRKQALVQQEQVITQGAQAITQGQQQIASNSMANAQAQQNLTERQNVVKILSSKKDLDGNSIEDESGDHDVNKTILAISKAAPTTGQQYIQQIIKTHADKVGLAQNVTDLNKSQREGLSGVIGSFINDPNANSKSIGAGIDEYVRENPQAAGAAHFAGNLLSVVDSVTDPKKKAEMLKHLQQQLMNPTTLAPLQSPAISAVQGKKGMQFVQTNPNAAGGIGPVGEPVEQGTAPQIITTPSGQNAIVPTGGAGLPTVGGNSPSRPNSAPTGPRTATDDSPGMNAPRAAQDAYQQAVQTENAHVDEIRKADTGSYGQNMLIANRIRELAKNVNTGQGSQALHNFFGTIGSVVGASNVSDYQTLSAYLDRQAATLRGTMGLPNTNQGSTEARDISGNAQYQRDAILEKNDLNQALAEGLHQYREGIDRIAGFGGQASPKAVQQFKSEWTKYFDPNVYRAELAAQRGQAEAQAFVKTLDPAEARSLKAKRAALAKLSQGQTP